MHPDHLAHFVNGFLAIGTPMIGGKATTWDILIAMSETGRASMGTVVADAILCHVRARRDLVRAGRMALTDLPDVAAMVSEAIDAARTGIVPSWC